ncbi:hypothetical protein L9F63_019312, partial [Diploptera punctata]
NYNFSRFEHGSPFGDYYIICSLHVRKPQNTLVRPIHYLIADFVLHCNALSTGHYSEIQPKKVLMQHSRKSKFLKWDTGVARKYERLQL